MKEPSTRSRDKLSSPPPTPPSLTLPHCAPPTTSICCLPLILTADRPLAGSQGADAQPEGEHCALQLALGLTPCMCLFVCICLGVVEAARLLRPRRLMLNPRKQRFHVLSLLHIGLRFSSLLLPLLHVVVCSCWRRLRLVPSQMGTVTSNVAEAVKQAKRGRADFRADKTGVVHVGIGKVSDTH